MIKNTKTRTDHWIVSPFAAFERTSKSNGIKSGLIIFDTLLFAKWAGEILTSQNFKRQNFYENVNIFLIFCFGSIRTKGLKGFSVKNLKFLRRIKFFIFSINFSKSHEKSVIRSKFNTDYRRAFDLDEMEKLLKICQTVVHVRWRFERTLASFRAFCVCTKPHFT